MGMSKIFCLKSFFFLLVLSGCNYKSSNSKFGDSRGIYIEVVRNDTLAPQIGTFLSKKIRDQIIRRGHFEIESDIRNSEFILTVSLTDYRKDTEI